MPSRLSTEFWKVPVTGTVNGATVDVSADPVYLAVVGSGQTPTDADWHAADWEAMGNGRYAARILVGPDGGALDFSDTQGTTRLYVWVKVVDSPETPVLNAGGVVIS